MRTERGAHALRCVAVLSLTSAGGGRTACSAAALREALPPSLWLLSGPSPLPTGGPLDGLRRAVRRQVFRYALPYAALGSCAGAARAGRPPCPGAETRVWLTWTAVDASAYLDGCSADDVEAMLSEAGVGRADVRMAQCGGFCELAFGCEAAAVHAAQLLDRRAWQGGRLLALPLPEACAKLEVHRRLKALFRRLSSGGAGGRTRDYSPFMSDKWRQRNAHPLHLSVAGSSSIQGDLRGGRHGAGAAGGARRWQCDDWVVVELSAAEFGAQQVRRIIGAVVAAARGSSSEQGAGASLEKHFGGDALPPLAPVEPLWLHSLTLVDGTSLTASEQLDGEVPAQRTDAETAIEHAVIRTAQTPIDEFVRALDADVSLSGATADDRHGSAAGEGEGVYERMRVREGLATLSLTPPGPRVSR